MNHIIRTPDERFINLPDFPFPPHYVQVGETRIHYIDEGAGEMILCLHGEPSWSYLYRHMIPPLAHRHRVIAPDFVGFGRSDKYTDPAAYTFHMHHSTLIGFIQALDLRGITLVVQDWGGLLGLTVATQLPDRFARLVIMNTGLPVGDPMPEAFNRWRDFAVSMGTRLPIGRVIQGGTTTTLSPEILAAYEAPFPDERYKVGAAIWPALIPTSPDDPGAAEMRAAREQLRQWRKPAITLFSDSDPITAGGDLWFRRLLGIRTKDQPRIVIENAGHFLQEDKGREIADHILDFITTEP